MPGIHRRRSRILAAPLAAIALAACGGHHLADYEFANGTLAVVSDVPPYPEFHTGPVDVGDLDNPVTAVLNAGARVAKEVEVRKARARLDSAATRFDVGDRMAERTAERAGRYLATTPTADARSADFLLEVYVQDFGINATSWNRAASLYVNAEAVLIDGRSGREIWASDVRAWETLTPRLWDTGPVPEDAVTAAALMSVSVEEFEGMLERLSELAADAVTNRLRDELRDVREDRRPRT